MPRAIFIFVVLALMSARLCADQITVWGCGAYPPYSYAVQQAGKSLPAGLDTEIVQAVFARMEGGVLIQLQDGVGLYRNSETVTASYQWPNDTSVAGIKVGPLRTHRMVFATRNDSPLTAWEKVDDLKPYSIGVIAGYVYDRYGPFHKAEDLKRVEFYSGDELLVGLRDGKVDVVVGEHDALVWSAKKAGILDKVKFLPKALYEDARCIMFNEKQKELAGQCQKALDEFKKTDAYAGILKKWETGAYDVPADPPAPADASLKEGILRIHCGGAAITDAAGNRWAADREYQEGQWGALGGKVVARDTRPIGGTKTEILYQTERYGLSAYRIPIRNGKYTVTLHFAETYDAITAADQRVFTVAIQGRKCLEAFDPFKEAGGKAFTAVVRPFDVEVKTGELMIEFTPDKQDPIINGIEIVPAP